MKKKLLMLLTFACVACLSAVLLTGCSSSNEEAESSEDTSADISTLIVGFDNSYPPYGFMDENNEPTGFDLDLAAEVANRNGWELQLEAIDWDAKDALLNQDSINCIWNGFTMEGREDDYAFTAPYMENRQVIVVRSDSGIEKLEDLAGKVVLTQADSAALGLLEPEGDQADLGATFADLQTIGEYNTAFMMLETGSVDAVALDYPVAVFQIGDRKDDFLILEEPLNSEHYAVGFAKGNEDLAAAVEADLLALVADGTVEELCEKYADQGVSFDAWVLGTDDKEKADDKGADAKAAGLKDGEYTAEGKGIGGKVPVTVVVKDGAVAEVTVGDNSETQGIGSKAVEQLPALIVEAGGTEGVDGVSGATITSKAIFSAVEDALAQAQA